MAGPKVQVEVSTVNLEKTRQQLRSLRSDVLGVATAEKQAASQTKTSRGQTQASIDRTERALLRQIKAVNSAQQAMKAFQSSLDRSNVPLERQFALMQQTSTAFRVYANAMTQGKLSARDLQNVQLAFNTTMQDAKQEVNAYKTTQTALNASLQQTKAAVVQNTVAMEKGAKETSNLKLKMTELTKAVQIALGPLSGIAARITAFSGLTSGAGLRVAGVISALIGVGGLVHGAERASAAVDNLRKTSERTGLSFKRFQELAFAASQSGIRIDQFSTAMEAFNRRLSDARNGIGSAADAFRRMGVSIQDLRDLDVDQAFSLVADKVKDMGDNVSAAGVAADLFSRGQIRMSNLLQQGSSDINKMAQEAHNLGIILEDEIAIKSTKLQDSLDKLGRVIKDNLIRAISALMPTLTNVVTTIAQFGPVIKRNVDIIVAAVATLGGVLIGGVFGPVGAGVGGALGLTLAMAANNLSTILELIKKLKTALADKRTGDLLVGESIIARTKNKKLKAIFEKAQAEKMAPSPIETFLEGAEKAIEKFITRNKELKGALDDLKLNSYDPVNKALFTNRQALASANLEFNNMIKGIENGFNPAAAAMAVQLGKATEETFSWNKEVLTMKGSILELSNSLNKLRDLQFITQLFQSTITPAEQYASDLERLNRLHDAGTIPQEVFSRGIAHIRTELLNTDPVLSVVSESFSRFGDDLFNVMQNSENRMENFKNAFRSLVNTLLKEILRLAVVNTVLNSLFNLGLPTIAGIGGGGKVATSSGGLGITGPAVPASPTTFPNVGAHGTSFDVGGSGIADRFIPIFARPGENVSIKPPENVSRSKMSGGGDTYIIDARGADQTQLRRLEEMIKKLNGSIEHRAVGAVTDARRRNPTLFAGSA